MYLQEQNLLLHLVVRPCHASILLEKRHASILLEKHRNSFSMIKWRKQLKFKDNLNIQVSVGTRLLSTGITMILFSAHSKLNINYCHVHSPHPSHPIKQGVTSVG
jgi:hypothetical protein